MKQYKGIIFNSVNVGLLNGDLGRVVTANNIRTAVASRNSQEGIEGAQAIAAAIFLARTGHSKQEIKKYIEETFGYDLDKTVAEHRATRSKNYVCSQSGLRQSAAGLRLILTSKRSVIPSPSAPMLTP